MKKIIFMGKSQSGKTTLCQKLHNLAVQYRKTQAVEQYTEAIDTPGEYAQTKGLGRALALYSYEADVIGLLMSATEPYSLYPPCVTAAANREVIGIITKCDHEHANIAQAENWLRLAGCDKIFPISSYTGEGIDALMDYLAQDTKKIPERI